jgi:2-polyprenyl-6-methoxyphenol hydroxylase-like FAD-dependent oxidoreductase/predicted DsbA family dithiol-disulfide isomerase
MKVVIIGGGISGLTLGIFLAEKKIEVVVNERSTGIHTKGHAFLMHSDGLAILNELAQKNNAVLPGENIEKISIKRPEGEEVKSDRLSNWQCIKRTNLIQFLYSVMPAGVIKEGRKFSNFIYKDQKIIAAAFDNGEVEYGDIFVGADGGNSKVRNLMFGATDFTPIEVKEIMGVVTNEKLAQTYAATFTKFQHKNKGLSFGFIPASKNEFVWFMQYNSITADVASTDPADIKEFCFEQLDGFPPVVKEVLEVNDFANSYVWNTTDFDLLSSFHKDNVALIGDAAHLSLPFTSAGTSNGVLDAKTLADCISESAYAEKAFDEYYKLRSNDILEHITLGRDLKKAFLDPQNYQDTEIRIPLINNNKTMQTVEKATIDVLYFTDPICSTCWIIEPILRKLKLEYGKYLNFTYRMGGLLPSWNEYNRGKINKPSDAAQHWEEVSTKHQIPLDGDVWFDDPLSSSFPPSIAFKAAQMQDEKKALMFLRRIKEMVFLEKKNIIKWEYLEEAAAKVCLNKEQFFKDYHGEAEKLFLEDMKLAEKHGVNSFPTFFFADPKNAEYTLKGYQPYEKYEELILKLIPGAVKEEIALSGETLFDHFPTMTDKEFSYLSNNLKETSAQILNRLFENDNIEKFETKNGNIWKNKVECSC